MKTWLYSEIGDVIKITKISEFISALFNSYFQYPLNDEGHTVN